MSQAQLRNDYLYINSFLKTSGSDYKFKINTPLVNCKQISLAQVQMDVWMPNFYDTTGKKFSEFGLFISNIIYKCDVFISSLAEFVLWFNNQSPRYKLQLQAVPSYQKVFSFKIQDSNNGNAFVNTSLIGDGWQKLGFIDYTTKQTHTGTRIIDLSLPPSFLIRINNPTLKQNIITSIGQAHFSVPNTANFGGKNFYVNDTDQEPLNTIYLQQPQQINQIEIEILNCDYSPIYSCDFGNGRDQNDAEVVLVFAIKQ